MIFLLVVEEKSNKIGVSYPLCSVDIYLTKSTASCCFQCVMVQNILKYLWYDRFFNEMQKDNNEGNEGNELRREYWKDIFEKLDLIDGKKDGKIRVKDLKLHVEKLKENNAEKQKEFEESTGLKIKDVERLIARTDKNEDGKIVFNEFMRLVEVASFIEKQQWAKVFDNLDRADGDADEKIDSKVLKDWLKNVSLRQDHIELEANTGLDSDRIRKIIRESLKKADENRDGYIDKNEFLNMVYDSSGNLSQVLDKSAFQQYLIGVAYAEECQACPPPLFILLITVIEVLIFVVSNTIYEGNPHYMNECSWLIYNPYRRQEIWRFLTYMFVHGSTMHLIFNLCAQLFVALPLEMVHGARRVGAVYLLGVLGILHIFRHHF